MLTINLHGLNLAEAETKLVQAFTSSLAHGERVVCVIHGQGKHSEHFPVLKSFVRRWLEGSAFAREHVETFFRGEDGSPYTRPNPGETVAVLRIPAADGAEMFPGRIEGEFRELPRGYGDGGREARRAAKAMRADRLRIARRRPHR